MNVLRQGRFEIRQKMLRLGRVDFVRPEMLDQVCLTRDDLIAFCNVPLSNSEVILEHCAIHFAITTN